MTNQKSRINKLWITVLITLFFSIFSAKGQVNPFPQYTYIEKDGKVSIEAEHFTANTGPWQEVEGRNAVTDRIAGKGVGEGTTLRVKERNHPMAGGFSGNVKIATDNIPVNWGYPNENASVATVFANNLEKAVCFGYEKGDQMVNMKAPAKRIGLFMGSSELNENGWALFDAAIKWAQQEASNEKILFVSAEKPLEGTDKVMASHLEKTGNIIEVVKDEESQTAHAEGKGLIFISETVSSGAVADKFKAVAVPVISCEPYVYDDMGMVVTKSLWRRYDEQYGNAMLISRGEWSHHLRYAIHFEHSGTYNLWMLGKNAGDSGADEVKVFFDPEKIHTEGDFYEVRFPKQLKWINEAYYDTPGREKNPGAATLKVQKPGWHSLYLVKGEEPESRKNPPRNRKYPNWRVDKIILTQSEEKPSGDGIPQTINEGSVSIPDKYLAYDEFLPSQVYKEHDGYIIIEAEDIDHHPYWNLKTSPKGYTGEGYLEWQGPSRTRSIEGWGGNHDSLGVCEGPPEEWLILGIKVNNPGIYKVNAVNYHEHEDGDNDAWVSKVGFQPDVTKETVISRMGDSFDDGKGFTWLDWGVREFSLKRGINYLYIAGRSVGFGLDRIAVYRKSDRKAKAKALDRNTPPSSKYRKK